MNKSVKESMKLSSFKLNRAIQSFRKSVKWLIVLFIATCILLKNNFMVIQNDPKIKSISEVNQISKFNLLSLSLCAQKPVILQ